MIIDFVLIIAIEFLYYNVAPIQQICSKVFKGLLLFKDSEQLLRLLWTWKN